MMCSIFGWSIEQVMALTWPQFEYISLHLYRIQYSRAKNEIYFGVSAAFGGDNGRRNLYKSAGSFVYEETPVLSYTQEELERAMKKADEIIGKGNVNA